MCIRCSHFVCVVRRSHFLCHKVESSFCMCYKADSLCMCYKAEIFVCVIGGVILYVIRRSQFVCV